MAKTITLRQGYKVEVAGAPEQRVHDGPLVTGVALLGADCPGLRPRFAVETGNQVQAGQTLFVDRARPGIAFVAPASGRVAGIDHGPRRTLSSIRIETDEAAPVEAPAPADDTDTLRKTLQTRGLWPAFRSRPFGAIPAHDAEPVAIFVTALDTEPLAPDPVVVLTEAMDDFHRGIAALKELTRGPVFVCERPDAGLVPDQPGVTAAGFEGPHPAGLVGTHIHHLFPASAARPVWTIGYQDTAGIGALLRTGRYPAGRVVALAGPRVDKPRLTRTTRGVRLRDLTEGALRPSPDGRPARVVSGSVLLGRDAAYLGARAQIVTVLDGAPKQSGPAWLKRLARAAPHGPRPIVPTQTLEHAAPLGIPPVPLLRALSVGDVETARRLGAEDLVEEDLALLSTVCTSRTDYGVLLRRVLDDMAEAV